MTSVSMKSGACGFSTVAKLPRVFGCVPEKLKMVAPLLRPVMMNGIGVVLE